MPGSLPIIGERQALYTADGTPLPYYLRPDLAYEEVLTYGPFGSGFAGLFITVQGRAYSQIKEVFCQYVAGAGVANRVVFMAYNKPEGGTLWYATSPAAQTANTTQSYQWSQSFTNTMSFSIGTGMPLSPFILPPKYTYGVFVQNNDLSDSVNSIVFTVRQFPTGPPNPETPSLKTEPVLLTTALV